MAQSFEKIVKAIKNQFHIRFLLLALPIVLIGVYFLSFNKASLYLIGSDQQLSDPNTTISCFSDSRENNGKSEIHILNQSTDRLSFKYTLKQGAFPVFAKVKYTRSDNSFFNLVSYDYVKIKIKATQGVRIQFYLASYIKNFTNPEKEISYQYLLNNLNVKKDFTEIKIPVKDLYTPDWWFIFNNTSEKDFDAPDLTTIQSIYFANCINIQKDVEDIVEIEELSFHVDYLPFYISSGIFVLFYYGLFVFIYLRKPSIPKAEVKLNYEKLESRNYQDKEEEMVFNFLAIHFPEPELTVTMVQNATGLHERKVSAIIKKKTDLSFKQYVNLLRISEAKILLSESDLPVSEIAIKAGFGNSSNFSRVFKTFENCTPIDFRKNHSQHSPKPE